MALQKENMDRIPYRHYHLFTLLDEYFSQQLPLDLCIHHYFRTHKALGPKDRGFIAETIYGLIRWQGLIDYLTNNSTDWEKRLHLYLNSDFEEISHDSKIPLSIRVSFPEVLFEAIARSHDIHGAEKLCRINNFPAPTTLRVNTLKISREELFKQWKEKFDISCCALSSEGIIFHKKINFFELPEFKAGFFEVQDEGSQLLANLVKPTPGDHILDYCSGSGGKTLAFAPHLQGKGQLFLHDIRSRALAEAKKRLKRAGIQNMQIVEATDLDRLKKLKKKMDWVLVDAPCSGTGTLRRNPDMKWKFDDEMLTRLTSLQRQIFEKALSFLKPEGQIVYATCSILNEENQHQIDHFIKTYNLELTSPPFQSLPSKGGMDGFFGATLRRRGEDKIA